MLGPRSAMIGRLQRGSTCRQGSMPGLPGSCRRCRAHVPGLIWLEVLCTPQVH